MEPALMIPAFSTAISAGVFAEQPRMVDSDRRDDGDRRVGDVRDVPGATEADLDHGDVDRRVGERGDTPSP